VVVHARPGHGGHTGREAAVRAGHDLDDILGRITGSLRPDGNLFAVHWLHPVAEYPRSGTEVHRALATRPGLARLAEHRERDFLAEVYARTDGEAVSVAQATGFA
jgi:hypothetical protein